MFIDLEPQAALFVILGELAQLRVADHGYKGIAAVTAGKQSGIPVRRPVTVSGSGILLSYHIQGGYYAYMENVRALGKKRVQELIDQIHGQMPIVIGK